jgi:hypothetical protein
MPEKLWMDPVQPHDLTNEGPDHLLQELLTLTSVVSVSVQLLRRRHERGTVTDPATMRRLLGTIERASADLAVRIRLVEKRLQTADHERG